VEKEEAEHCNISINPPYSNTEIGIQGQNWVDLQRGQSKVIHQPHLEISKWELETHIPKQDFIHRETNFIVMVANSSILTWTNNLPADQQINPCRLQSLSTNHFYAIHQTPTKHFVGHPMVFVVVDFVVQKLP